MTDTAKASVITDHPFVPRALRVRVLDEKRRIAYELPSNRWLCGHQGVFAALSCNMAEAAHRETTVKR